MARYDLPQYQSMYRDPQSVAINTALRQRYVENFAGADALQGAVDDMTSADFEGDKLEKQQLVDKYNAELNEMSTQGDYESKGMRVANNARDFVQDYKPVQKNKKKYDDYVAELDRLRKAGIDGGGISEFVYKRKLAQAKHGYFGLQRNEEGKIDEGSYFSGPGVVKSVDYIKVLDDALTGIKPDKASTVFDIPQDQLVLDQYGRLNVDPMVDRKTGTVKYWVETTEGRVEVSADRVQRIVGDVLADPSVRMSMEQDADLTTFDMSQEDITATLDEEFAKLDKQILEAKTDEDKEVLEERKQEWLDKQANEGDLSLVRSLERNNIMYRALDASIAKHAYLETERKKLLDYDDDDQRNKDDKTNQNVPRVDIDAPFSEKGGLGGSTYTEKKEYVTTTQSVIDDSYKNLINKNKVYAEEIDKNKNLVRPDYTVKTLEDIQTELHNIQNAEEFEELAKEYRMTPEDFRGAVTEILENESRVNLVNQKIEETTKVVQPKGDDYYFTVTDKKERINGKDIVDNFKNVVTTWNNDPENADNQFNVDLDNITFNDVMSMMYTLTPDGKIPEGQDGYLTVGVGVGNYIYPVTRLVLDSLIQNGKLPVGTREKHSIDQIRKQQMEVILKEQEKYNEEFGKKIKTDAVIMKNFGTTDDEGRANTTAVQNAFKDVFKDGLPPGFNIRTMDGLYEGAWKTYMKGEWWNKTAEYTVNEDSIGMSNVPTVDGKHMLYVPITFTKGPEKGKTTYFLVDSAQLKSPSLDDWTNSAEFKVQRMYARGEWANVDEYKPEMFNNVTFDYDKTNPANSKIYIDLTVGDDDDGIDNPIEHTKAEGLAYLANVYANLGYADLFDVIKYKRGLR